MRRDQSVPGARTGAPPGSGVPRRPHRGGTDQRGLGKRQCRGVGLSSSLERGIVARVRFDPTEGRQIRKTRPAVVVSNDVACRFDAVVQVVPVTILPDRDLRPYESRCRSAASGLARPSRAVANQIRTVSRNRIGQTIGSPHSRRDRGAGSGTADPVGARSKAALKPPDAITLPPGVRRERRASNPWTERPWRPQRRRETRRASGPLRDFPCAPS